MRTHAYGLSIDVHADPAVDSAGLDTADISVFLRHRSAAEETRPSANAEPWYTSIARDGNGTPELIVRRSPLGHFLWRYCDGTEFIVDASGHEIHATWPPPLTVEDALGYVFGPVLGFVLRRRGVTCLHGSTVVIGGRAVVFTGPPGAGKSTTAAAFAHAGFAVLTDDIAALLERDGAFLIHPELPRILLTSVSARALWSEGALPERLAPTWAKHCLDLSQPAYTFCRQPAPVGVVYIMEPRDPSLAAPVFRSVSGADALAYLVANTHGNKLLDQEMRIAEFETLGRLLNDVPVRRMCAPADLDGLEKLRNAILDDCRALGLR